MKSVHSEWAHHSAKLRVTSLDLKAAYKQFALHPAGHNKAVVTLKNPDSNSLKCYITLALPFGATASVTHFLRGSLFLHAVGCLLGTCWSSYFDDFPMVSHAATATSTLASTKALLHMLGFECSKEKLAPFAEQADMLGVTVDVSQSHKGLLRARNKSSRVNELAPKLERVLVKGHVAPAELPSFVGKLQYADAQVFGRAGSIALHEFRNLGHVSRAPVPLSPQSVAAVEKLRKRILHGRPRTLKATWRDPPVVIFTDGALQEASELGSEATIGGALFPPDNQSKVEVFGSHIQRQFLAGGEGTVRIMS